ncbi:MAG: transporter permease [Paenibacillaceae bacterium]|nr:transporter permease [Paenibacillaceae bacterium]
MRESTGDRIFGYFNAAILLVIGLIAVFPLYYVFVLSFTHPDEYARGGLILFPTQWSLIAYEYLLSTKAFLRAMGVSVFLAGIGTACSLVVTGALAYVVSRKRLTGRRLIMLGVLLTTLFNPGMIPPYLLVRDLGLINSLWSLILPMLASGWYVLLMKGFYEGIPESLEEAAAIDGCGDYGIFLRIILPLSLPAMAAFGLFYAVAYWNTYFHAVLYINDTTKWPLQVLLQNMLVDASAGASSEMSVEIAASRDIPHETKKMAAVVIATLPIVMVYPFLQKHFAKGAMVGSVKG